MPGESIICHTLHEILYQTRYQAYSRHLDFFLSSPGSLTLLHGSTRTFAACTCDSQDKSEPAAEIN